MESVEPAAAPDVRDAGRLLTRRMRELFRVYPRALVGDVEAVHDVRVAARRLRVALALLVEKPRGRRTVRADRTLRELARAAGRGRDLDVGLAILEASPVRVHESHARLHRALRASRSRARTVAREMLLDLDIADLRRDLRQLVANARVDRATLGERVDALRRDGEETIARELAAARTRRDGNALHGARRAARRLRYAEEIVELFERSPSDAANRWRKIQTRLGEIQDRHVLGVWLASRERLAAARGDAPLAMAARRARLRVSREAERRTREFLAADGASVPSLPA